MKAWAFWVPKDSSTYGYIDICIESLKKHQGKFEFTCLDWNSLEEVTGKDYKQLFEGDLINNAVDLARLDVLFQHGGFWIDVDTIALRDYSPMWEWRTESFSTFAQPGSKARYGGFMMCDAGNSVCYDWYQYCMQLIPEYTGRSGFFQFGRMEKILRQHSYDVFHAKHVVPVENWRHFLSDQKHMSDYEMSYMVQLFNSYLCEKPIVNASREDILSSNTLLGEISRAALGIV